MNPEVVGMLGTVVLVVGLMLSDMYWLRVIGIISNALFIVYALMFTPILVSILVTNLIIVGVHVYKLKQISTQIEKT